MKLKQLESHLQRVSSFTAPNILLEQYPTSAHLAAQMIYTIHQSYDDIESKVVLDLGIGPGILGIGAALLQEDGGKTYGIDVDAQVLKTTKANCEALEVDITLINCDLEKLVHSEHKITISENVFSDPIDVVIMNPPFGTKKKGIDMVFLQKAIEIASVAVYSLHKTSTRSHIVRRAQEWGWKAEVIAQMRFALLKHLNVTNKILST